MPNELKKLLEKYKGVFEEHKALPLFRTYNHSIPLQSAAQPISIRPYRYPHFQKTKIEKLIAKMLENPIIQPRTNPYSSPMLLVKRKDGIWRFCAGYRRLNDLTIKDKFPISIIDDLDELHGAAVFSKIDLRADYHQTRMQPENISKTTFRTHHGYFEFKVMPFGLLMHQLHFKHS